MSAKIIPFPSKSKSIDELPGENSFLRYRAAYVALRDSIARDREERRIKEWRDGVHERVNRAVEEFKRRHP